MTQPPPQRSNNSVSVLSRFRVGVANPLPRLAGVRLCVFDGGVHCFGPLKARSALPDGFSCRQVLHLQREQNLLLRHHRRKPPLENPSQPPTSCSATDQRGVFTHSCPSYDIGGAVWTSNAPPMPLVTTSQVVVGGPVSCWCSSPGETTPLSVITRNKQNLVELLLPTVQEALPGNAEVNSR